MKEIFKKTFSNPVWKHILTALSIIVVIDWIVFPSLTAPSTIFNVIGLLVAAVLGVFVGVYIKENFLDKN
jgi:hypothetical protein